MRTPPGSSRDNKISSDEDKGQESDEFDEDNANATVVKDPERVPETTYEILGFDIKIGNKDASKNNNEVTTITTPNYVYVGYISNKDIPKQSDLTTVKQEYTSLKTTATKHAGKINSYVKEINIEESVLVSMKKVHISNTLKVYLSAITYSYVRSLDNKGAAYRIEKGLIAILRAYENSLNAINSTLSKLVQEGEDEDEWDEFDKEMEELE